MYGTFLQDLHGEKWSQSLFDDINWIRWGQKRNNTIEATFLTGTLKIDQNVCHNNFMALSNINHLGS